jgi:hypothetical protein
MKTDTRSAASAVAESAARAVSARCARRIAKHERKVLAWWACVPADARRTHYLGADIAAGVGVAMVLLGPALKALGWRREQVRLDGAQVGVWVPPGAPSIKRPLGRPSFSQLCSGGTP